MRILCFPHEPVDEIYGMTAVERLVKRGGAGDPVVTPVDTRRLLKKFVWEIWIGVVD